MSKTYILEPTSVNLSFMMSQFNGVIGHDTSITDGIELGTILEISGNKLICVSAQKDQQSWGFALNGDTSEGTPGAGMYIDGGSTVKITGGGLTGVESDGSYMVSIYTGEDDEPEDADPYPVKNFTYEHAEVAKNDIEDIIQAIYTRIGETESQAPHGYSPADRLVIAVAKLHGVVPVTALTTGNYPNQMKRIAAIIRGDFGTGGE